MVSSLKYKNSSTFAINLSGDSGLYGQAALKIRGYAWDYSTGDHALAGVSRSAREADLEIIAYREEGRRSLDTLIEQSTLDMDIQKPGILFIDDWQTDCYIPKIEISTVNPQYIKATLTIVLLNGVWRRGVTTMLQANTATPPRPHFWTIRMITRMIICVPSLRSMFLTQCHTVCLSALSTMGPLRTLIFL